MEVKRVKGKVIFLLVMLISLALMMISMAFVEETPAFFIIFLIIYMGSSMIATCTYTPIGNFFNYGIPKEDAGNIGCIIAPLYIIVFPIIGFVSCFIGPFVLIAKIINASKDQ